MRRPREELLLRTDRTETVVSSNHEDGVERDWVLLETVRVDRLDDQKDE